MRSITLRVNGQAASATVSPRTSLADFLREDLLLTGTHLGCEHGICGACTVEIDGEIARSCITYAVTCDGADVRTIEGFDDDALMARLRRAFTEEHALQCGYCTPGMLIAARDLVRRKAGLTRGQIRHEMSGNLCRCTGYMGIVSAIERVMQAAPGIEQPRVRPHDSWLGPAPGPAAETAPGTEVPPVADRAASAPMPAARTPAHARAPGRRIDIVQGAVTDKEGALQFTQSFVLQHPRDAVWRLMSDVERVARCMPGVELDGPPDADGRVTGRISVKLGPIAASFVGAGEVKQFAADFRQVIEGRGGDRKSGSRVSGSVDYRLTAVPGAAGGEATRADVAIAYALTGMLAQLGRSNLAQDLARRLGEAFAHNIDAELSDPGGAAPPHAELGGLSLIWQVLAARLRAMIGRLLGTRG